MAIWIRSGIVRWAVLLATSACLFGLSVAWAQQDESKPDDSKPENPFPGRIKSPGLDGGSGWLNSAGPIDLAKLKGKVVLLDFWTYCCINCMHILPDLAKLEKEFPNELVVIGVHSAKFDGEKVTENIRDAVLRYDVLHPVVNDAEMQIWRKFGVQAWPTQVLIDPEGYYVGSVSGEGHYDNIRAAIKKLIEYHESKGTLDRTPLHFQLEEFSREQTPLKYPGKIAVDPDQKRLFIADSGHHRIVVVELPSGKRLDTIGSGSPKLADGSFENASFFEPQGIAVDGELLYVADRKNHAIRKVDLKNREVTTIAGTGKQGYDRWPDGPALKVDLSSPWAIAQQGNTLYIAMAGVHQIWKLDLESGRISQFAGSGRENIYDGELQQAAFAQPSGLALDGSNLYVADSETSAIRRINLDDESVETIVGQGLFEFGDIDGVGDKARLQHALAVVVQNGILYVADTYNNKLKTIDPASRQTKTFLGDGKPELSNDPPRFDEPGGLAIAQGKLYVADTDNHAIRVVDLANKSVTTLNITGLEPGPAPETTSDFPEIQPNEVAPVALKTPGNLAIQFHITLPEGQKLNPQAPMSYRVRSNKSGQKSNLLAKGSTSEIAPDVQIQLDNVDLSNAESIDIALTWYPCDIGAEGVCRIQSAVWRVPISTSETGSDRIELDTPKP